MPGQVGDLPHNSGKLLMWRRPPACVSGSRSEAGILSQLLSREKGRMLSRRKPPSQTWRMFSSGRGLDGTATP